MVSACPDEDNKYGHVFLLIIHDPYFDGVNFRERMKFAGFGFFRQYFFVDCEVTAKYGKFRM